MSSIRTQAANCPRGQLIGEAPTHQAAAAYGALVDEIANGARAQSRECSLPRDQIARILEAAGRTPYQLAMDTEQASRRGRRR